MDIELAAGFTAVIVSLAVIAILVYASRGIIEKTHRKTVQSNSEAKRGSEEAGNHVDA